MDVEISVNSPAGRPPLRVFGWNADKEGCGYYRVALPLMGLRDVYAAQVKANGTFNPDEFGRWDMLVAQRTATPGPSFMLSLMVNAGLPVVFEIDDLLTGVDSTNSDRAYRFWNDANHRKMLLQNMRLSDAVIVSSEPLVEAYRRYNSDIHLIPNYVHEQAFHLPRHPKQDLRLCIGWGGGSSHSKDILEAASAVEAVMEKYPVTFKTIGVPYGTGMKIDQERYTHVDWQQQVPDYYRHLNFDIGIAPLSRTRFNEHKSYIKALEYGMSGIPIVASKWGPYERYIEHGVDGFLCRNYRDWVRFLTALIQDGDMRREMGRNAKDKAKSQTIQANAWRYYDLLQPFQGHRESAGEKLLALYNSISPEQLSAVVQAQTLDNQRYPAA